MSFIKSEQNFVSETKGIIIKFKEKFLLNFLMVILLSHNEKSYKNKTDF